MTPFRSSQRASWLAIILSVVLSLSYAAYIALNMFAPAVMGDELMGASCAVIVALVLLATIVAASIAYLVLSNRRDDADMDEGPMP